MFPNSRLLKLLVFLSVGLQLIIVSQMYFFNNELFDEPVQVVIRLLRGIILTFIGGAILVYPCLFLIRYLNQRIPWKRNALKRFFIQFPLGILGGLMVTPIILLPASYLFGLESDLQTLINNAYYLVVLALFLMIILEARLYFDESAGARLAAQKLQQELMKEASDRAMFEAQMLLEEEKNRFAQKLIEQEKQLSRNLEVEIEKREQISLELKESREQLQSILSNLAGAAYRCWFDEEYTMKYLSEKIFDISGYHAEDFIDNRTRSFDSIIHPGDRDLCRKNIMQASLLKTHYEFEYRIIHHDGSTVWVSENGKGICNDEGILTFLDGIIIDITRRKEAEFAAAESERNFKELMELFPQPIFELDIDGNILFTNRSGKEFFGLVMPENPEEKISALDFMVKEDVPRVQENIKKSNQAILSTPIEYTVKRPDGSRCPVMIYGSPIIRNDKVVGRRGIIIDISEQKKYAESLLNAKNELEQINNNLEQIVLKRTKELTEINTELFKVQKENLQSQFEVLKSQINPHFMFNSLNVLSGLINTDVAKAQLFIDEFSQIYRYVLETIDQPVVSLNQEFDFMRSYLFLQQIRYGESLTYSVDIVAEQLQLLVPPLSLQVLLENAMKHNIVNEEKPLKIEIYSEGDFLFIKNPIQPKISGTSTGLGLKNLIKRYALICKLEPIFKVENNYYIAKIPLIKVEQDERTNN